ncbi:MAG: hypothetical protein JW934_21025 [Anaerolineae bacterium]|nr:hypothetical protein [Anaerolineae bacterium]
MLGVIVQHSVDIVTFISWLSPALYQPQIRHLIRLVDALLVCDSKKTLTNISRQLAAKYDPKTAADFFRESPWQVIDVSGPRKRWMLLKFLVGAEAASRPCHSRRDRRQYGQEA